MSFIYLWKHLKTLQTSGSELMTQQRNYFKGCLTTSQTYFVSLSLSSNHKIFKHCLFESIVKRKGIFHYKGYNSWHFLLLLCCLGYMSFVTVMQEDPFINHYAMFWLKLRGSLFIISPMCCNLPRNTLKS